MRAGAAAACERARQRCGSGRGGGVGAGAVAAVDFSVSATWNCVRPSLETVSHRPLDCLEGAKTMGEVKDELYCVICRQRPGVRCFSLLKSGLTWWLKAETPQSGRPEASF